MKPALASVRHLAIALAAVLASTTAAAANEGNFDPTWQIPTWPDELVLDATADAQGRVYVALLDPDVDGTATVRLVRLVDGAVDPTFLSGTGLSDGPDWTQARVAVNSQWVYLAQTWKAPDDPGGRGFMVMRFNLNGNIFNFGPVDFNLGGDNDDALYGLAVSEDRVVLCGSVQRNDPADVDFGIAVLDHELAPVTSFSGDGRTTFAFDVDGLAADVAYDVAFDGAGGYIVVGEAETSTGSRGAVVHFNETGAVLASATHAFSPSVGLFATDNDFRDIVVDVGVGGTSYWIAGSTTDPTPVLSPSADFAMVKLSSGLAVDTSHGVNGWSLVDFSTPGVIRHDRATRIARDGSGRFYLAGFSKNAGDHRFATAVARRTSSALPDLGWRSNGKALYELFPAPWDEVSTGLAIDNKSRPIIAGFSTAAAQSPFGWGLRLTAAIFDDGFESGTTTAWSTTVP